ncbi:Non-reducing polyketide synthase PKS1 [Frankliniella fusca]|uniref:Non-reducing polyketide synthase PKS1 n=1 Tax=Frankliniella fusca TaxID=407009 RepID=A0AAE1LHT1_9NEOP|nr:Non-reducing polyketide synthase PKS1 [Frankliniella fusca]
MAPLFTFRVKTKSGQCPDTNNNNDVHPEISPLHEAAHTSVYVSRDLSQETKNEKRNNLDTAASTSCPSPDLDFEDCSTITLSETQQQKTLNVARKLDFNAVPSPNVSSPENPQTADDTHASSASSGTIPLLTPLPIRENTMIFDAQPQISPLHEAARTRVYVRRDLSQETTNEERSRSSLLQSTQVCRRYIKPRTDNLDTAASTSCPYPDLDFEDCSTITVSETQQQKTLNVSRKLDFNAVPSPNVSSPENPQTADDTHASSASSGTISLLTSPPIRENTMIFDAGALDLGNIFDDIDEGQSVIFDLPIANTEKNLEEATVNPEGEPEERLQGNFEIAQDDPVIVAREEVGQKQVTRKRARNPTQHKAAEAKRALYAGEAHVNKKGQFRPAPSMRVPCACKFKCSTKITEGERHKIFTIYNCTFGCKDKQWAYVRAHSSTVPVTKTTTHHETPQRKVSRKYFLDVTKENGGVISNVHEHPSHLGWGDSAYKHMNQKTKTPTSDKRGKHSNRPKKTTAEQRESVKTHINSYLRIPSHYVRSRIQREYVETGLTAAKMFRQYKEWCVSQSIPEKNRASRSQYKQIFNFEFNIGFYRPKKDKCQLCALMKNGTRQEREHFKEAWISHFNSKKACYAEQKKAREIVSKKESCAMLSFDLQKVLPCPKSDTSVFFYKNKLSVYNLTVYESRSHIRTCYLWHEGIAKRGANEIGSCLMKALVHQAQEGKTEIYSFSDSCSGQNKNRFIYAMILQVSAIFGVKIRHCFLTPGHTYNDADSVHARIESATKGKEIYEFGEWIKEIENAKQNGPAYKVVQIERKDFFDLKELVSKQNWKINTEGQVIKWNKVRIIETDGSGEGILAYQYEINGSKYYLDTNQRRGHPVNLKTFKPKVAYPGNIPLKAKTIDHLRSLCRSLAIPSKYHPFYDNISAVKRNKGIS